MKLTNPVPIMVLFLALWGPSRIAVKTPESGSPADQRIQLLQETIDKQGAEMDVLRLRLTKLQKEIQELADVVVDQTTEENDDDAAKTSSQIPLQIRVRTKAKQDALLVARQ